MSSQFINEILPNLYLGSWHSTNLDLLGAHKIKEVFHFGFEIDEQSPEVLYNYFDLEDNSQSVGILKELLPQIHSDIKVSLEKGPTLVCCSAGKSRSVTVLISYLMLIKGFTFLDAFDLVKSKRSIINPNPTFLRMLEGLN